tara:strand:- start:101 stop:415 length:315 start_codon:yes stop_codon:yes gene_type:complete
MMQKDHLPIKAEIRKIKTETKVSPIRIKKSGSYRIPKSKISFNTTSPEIKHRALYNDLKSINEHQEFSDIDGDSSNFDSFFHKTQSNFGNPLVYNTNFPDSLMS